MKGNKIVIDRYLEEGELIDSLDLSVNYLVKSTREGGTVPLALKNTIITYNYNTGTYTTFEDTREVFNPGTYNVYAYNQNRIYSISGNAFKSYTSASSPSSTQFITSISCSFETFKSNDWGGSNFSALTTLNLPKCKTFEGAYLFKRSGNPTELYLPLCERLYGDGIRETTTLKTVILPRVTLIDNMALYSASGVEEMIIGTELDSVCTLDGSFNIVPNIQSIYVPDALVNDYKSATNWSIKADKIKGISERPTT